MGYLLIYIIIYPIFWLLKPFTKKRGGYLVIQSAKIGDYINTTVLFAALKKVDVAIESKNLPFAQNDSRIKRVYLLDRAKRNIFAKISLGLKLYLHGYDAVFIVMPNSYNLFLGRCSSAKRVVTLKTYATKWYERLLMLGMMKVEHTKGDLTLKSYLKMFLKNPKIERYPKKPFEPMFVPENIMINHSPNFKVGITLGAGNRIKVMETETWVKVFDILDTFHCEVYVFGTKEDEGILEELVSAKNYKNIKLFSLLDSLKLEDIPYHISTMNLFISSDTGLSYIADSYEVPLINFAGPCFMKEQRPVGRNAMIVESNAFCAPFSFIFSAPYEKKCNGLYEINTMQESEIRYFIQEVLDRCIQVS
jgi:ADP-heptose:LPS heptosyltransferase